MSHQCAHTAYLNISSLQLEENKEKKRDKRRRSSLPCVQTTPGIPYHSVCKVFIGENKCRVYNTEELFQWLKTSKFHPETGEDIGCVRHRVEWKIFWLKKYRDVLFSTITPDYRTNLLIEYLNLWSQRDILRGAARSFSSVMEDKNGCKAEKVMNNKEKDKKRKNSVDEIIGKAHAFVDLSTLDLIMSKSSATPIYSGQWLIRLSSQHSNVFEHSQIFVISSRCGGQLNQVRFMEIPGAGFTVIVGNLPTNITEISNNDTQKFLPSVLQAIKVYVSTHNLTFNSLVIIK